MSAAAADTADAVGLLLRDNVGARLPPPAQLVANAFRTERLYCEEVDLLLKKHQASVWGRAPGGLPPAIRMEGCMSGVGRSFAQKL